MSKIDKKEAVVAGIKGGASALIKSNVGNLAQFLFTLPGVKEVTDQMFGAIFEALDSYQNNIDEQKLQITYKNLTEWVINLEGNVQVIKAKFAEIDLAWMNSDQGYLHRKKLIKLITDDELLEKQQCFLAAFFSSYFEAFDENQKNKFTHLLRSLSLPSLEVLAAIAKEYQAVTAERAYEWCTVGRVVETLCNAARGRLKNWNPNMVELCVIELQKTGILSISSNWQTAGTSAPYRMAFVKTVEEFYITRETFKFVDFITNGTFNLKGKN